MEISQKLLAVMIAASVTVGAALGLVWDAIRLLRAIGAVGAGTHHGRASLPARVMRAGGAVLLFLTDMLFGVLCGLCAILLLYYTNDGQLRLSAVGGMAVGFAAWHITVGRLTCRLTNKVAVGLLKAGHAIGHAVVKPFRAMAVKRAQKAGAESGRKKKTRQAEETAERAVPTKQKAKKHSKAKRHPSGA